MHQKKVSIWTPFTQLSINPFQFNIYFQYYQKTSENNRTLSGLKRLKLIEIRVTFFCLETKRVYRMPDSKISISI